MKIKLDVATSTDEEIAEAMRTYVHRILRFIDAETKEMWFTDSTTEAQELYDQVSEGPGDTEWYRKPD